MSFPRVSLIGDMPCPTILQPTDIGEKGTLLIDDQAHVVAVGKPPKAKTFGDLADIFVVSIVQAGAMFNRKDIINWYYDLLINSGMWKKRKKKVAPVRQEIQERNAPRPQKWDNFITHAQNKADFLSQQLVLQASPNKTTIIAGGFSNKHVQSSTSDVHTEVLEAQHIEANTRIQLHCVKSQASINFVFLGHTKKSHWKIFTEHPWQRWSQWTCLCWCSSLHLQNLQSWQVFLKTVLDQPSWSRVS